MKKFLVTIFSVMSFVAVSGFIVSATEAQAAPFKVGPKKCQECHTAEAEVWKGTAHFKSYKDIHKHDKADAIVEAVGDKRMKRSETCTICHYSEEQKDAGDKPKQVAGPSCESCHGAASDWINIHNDYGKGVKREDEPAAHKAERIAKAEAAGMIRPDKLFDVASNCMACHGLARDELEAKDAAAMLDAGHPLKPEFELVSYSQGTVRHRFYPPDVTVNKEMTPAELSQLYVVGQAAALVSAKQAMSKSDHANYKAAQEKRIATATAALDAVKGQVPEAAALLADPSVANGRALAAAVKGKDLTGAVGGMLPKDRK
ncbi:MAG: cytochrome c family protein [Proteobacteria bacterium]|nr:cytochrome c family protein [Pseudomonadota bacterium]